MKNDKRINIVIPMAGSGKPFFQAGYTFPKPLIDVNGKSMIQLVAENLKPSLPHRFIFICRKDHYDQFSLNEIFDRTVNENYETILLTAPTQGAVCTVLTAADLINNDDDLIIANADQVVDIKIDDFIHDSRKSKSEGVIMTFTTTHPKWSFIRTDKDKKVIEVAEKKVISNQATVGIYYFKSGSQFIESSVSMIEKDIRFNNDFYVSLVYNEMSLNNLKVTTWNLKNEHMHSMATPEDLMKYMMYLMK